MFTIMAMVLAAIVNLSPLNNPTAEKAKASTVELVGTYQNYIPEKKEVHVERNSKICSGFLVASDLIATARHCVTKNVDGPTFMFPYHIITKTYPRKVQFSDGSTAKVLHITNDKYADLSYLQIEENSHSPVVLNSDVYLGEQVFVLGMPAGSEWAYSNAYVMQGKVPTKDFGDPEYNWDGTYLLDCPSCYGGDSGAAVFNLNGEVVGLLVAKDSDPEAALMEPAWYILHDLNGR